MSETPLISDKQIFEIIRNYKAVKVGQNEILSAQYDIDYNSVRIIAEQLILALRQGSTEMTVYDSYDVPKSTWQMFKFRHYNSWWLRWFVNRRPVRYDTHIISIPVEVTRYTTFPDAEYDITNPRLGSAVQLDILKDLRS